MPQYRMIEAGGFAEAKAGLQPMRDAALADLDVRLARMCDVLESVTPQIDACADDRVRQRHQAEASPGNSP